MDNFNPFSSSNQINSGVPQLPETACLPENLGLDACPWLDEYVDFSRIWSPESFDDYHEACGLFVLSTVAAGRVVFDLGSPRKTNLNTMLVGRTSIHAKSTASNIAQSLLREARLEWLLAPDEITPQKLISDMASNELPGNFRHLSDEVQQKEIHRVLTAGQRGWVVDEFGDNLKAMMQPNGIMNGIKGLIRTLDGSPSKYEYSTISRGKNLISQPYLPMLANVTIADLAPYARRGNTLWGDGFFARFATPTPPNASLSFGKFPNQQRIFPESLVLPLVNWNARLGFPGYKIVESEGKQVLVPIPLPTIHLKISSEVFEAHYVYHQELRLLTLNNQNSDLDGNYTRFPEKALRIAALFASFENSESIELKHWVKAQAITERWRIGLHELYQQITTTKDSPTTKYVKDMPIEAQIIRAIGTKLMSGKREICQFTGLKSNVVTPALNKLISECKVLEVKQDGKNIFILGKK